MSDYNVFISLIFDASDRIIRTHFIDIVITVFSDYPFAVQICISAFIHLILANTHVLWGKKIGLQYNNVLIIFV